MLEFWLEELGHCRLADLKAALIVEKRDKLSQGLTYRKKLRSPATCNRYVSGLSVILQCCVQEWGWLEQNSARRIRRLSESEGSTRIFVRGHPIPLTHLREELMNAEDIQTMKLISQRVEAMLKCIKAERLCYTELPNEIASEGATEALEGLKIIPNKLPINSHFIPKLT